MMNEPLYRLRIRICLVIAALLFTVSAASATEGLQSLRIWGNLQVNGQYYLSDTLSGFPEVPEKFLMNGYGNVNMSFQNFRAGFRFESYQPALLGYDPRHRGSGIPYRYAAYAHDRLEVTLGSFYEQFGNGMVLRSYEERSLGLDNALDGFHVVVRPIEGITMKGLIGQQRFFFNKGPGIVRGFDTEINLNRSIPAFSDNPNRWIVGGSFVSKYQRDLNPLFRLPENVGAFAGRINFLRNAINIRAEYAWKVNDPSADNQFIYKNGQALFIAGSFSSRGIGLLLSAKHIDNMGFRSDRNATGNDLHINFLPPTARQQGYHLAGMYPYATQVTGETGFQGELSFLLPRESLLGGPFGTTVLVNSNLVKPIRKEPVHDTIAIGQPGTPGYRSSLFSMDKGTYFHDLSLEVNRRFSRNLRGVFSYVYVAYNQQVVEQTPDKGMVFAHILIADMTLRLPGRKSLRGEVQHLSTAQDRGNWAMVMVEYHAGPKWHFSAGNQYNYGHPEEGQRIHYFHVGTGYTAGANRIGVAFGKQREGVVCAGGVCRRVPASYGLSIEITSSF